MREIYKALRQNICFQENSCWAVQNTEQWGCSKQCCVDNLPRTEFLTSVRAPCLISACKSNTIVFIFRKHAQNTRMLIYYLDKDVASLPLLDGNVNEGPRRVVRVIGRRGLHIKALVADWWARQQRQFFWRENGEY
jgi:hypothetical protein